MPGMVERHRRDAWSEAARVAALVERPGARRVLRLAAAGACGDAPTLFLPGCNLACVHCWAGTDRETPGTAGGWMSWSAMRATLRRFRARNRLGVPTDRVRLSGGEPVLSERFFDLLEGLLRLPGQVYVETNGTWLGRHSGTLARLASLRGRVFLKVSLKAGTAEQFERLTGTSADAWEAAWDCVAGLHRLGIPFDCNALTGAPELFTTAERRALLERLRGIAPELAGRLEEETLTRYPATVRRMAAAADAGPRAP